MSLKKVFSMQLGQYGYDSNSDRHLVRCPFSRACTGYRMYDVINKCYVIMHGDDLLLVINR